MMKKEKKKQETSKKMQKKRLNKVLKVIAIICAIILVAEGAFIFYQYYQREQKKVYTTLTSSLTEKNGSYYLVGSSDFKGSKVGYQKGYQKAMLAKYSPEGKLLFEKGFLDGYNSIYNDICAVEDGYIAVGQYEKTKTDHQEQTGTGLIVKYDKNGNVLEKKEVLVLADTQFYAVKPLSDGGYLVLGQTIFENMTLGFDERGGGLLIRYSKEGKELWRANFGGSKSGTFNDALVLEKENAIYVVGKDASRVGLLVKYDLNGKRIFVKNYEQTDTIGFSAIRAFNNELVIVGSKKLSEDRDDYKTAALLVKYSKDGKLLLEKTYQKNDMSRFNSIWIDDNRIHVVGHSAILNKEKTTKTLRNFDYSGIYVSFDATGKVLNSNEWKEKNQQTYFSKILKTNNKLLVIGQSNARLFAKNKKDMDIFAITIDSKGKQQQQLF